MDKQEFKLDSPSQIKEQSSFMDDDKMHGDYAPKIYSKESMTVSPDTDFKLVYDFL